MEALHPKMKERLEKWRKEKIEVKTQSIQNVKKHHNVRMTRKEFGDDLREFEERYK